MNQKIIASILTAVLLTVTAHATPERGIWCWAGLPGGDWDTTVFVGDPVREDAAIREFQRWNIKRMYGSYRDRVVDEPETIAAWNAKLHAAGISPILLLSENSWVFPEYRTNLLEINVQQELIDFNNSRINADERFVGLHLDIEPHGLRSDNYPNAPLWWESGAGSEGSTTNRILINLLRDTFEDTREYMDTNGATSIPIYADLPFWIDSSNKIGWTNITERDQWFIDVGTTLEGITLMAYGRSDYTILTNKYFGWEFENCPAEVRVGLEARIGTGAWYTWTNFNAFISMAQQIESDFGSPPGIDIHALKNFEAHVPLIPPTIGTPLVEGGGIILSVSNYYPGSINGIQYSTNLLSDTWSNVSSFVSWHAETNWTGPVEFPNAFYRVNSQ